MKINGTMRLPLSFPLSPLSFFLFASQRKTYLISNIYSLGSGLDDVAFQLMAVSAVAIIATILFLIDCSSCSSV
jgi:hypothetical protein